jgi:hypothetical protein
LQDFDPADVGSGSTGDIRNERGLQQRRPPTEAASESAFAILTKLVQRRSRDLRLQPFKRQVRIKSTNNPRSESLAIFELGEVIDIVRDGDESRGLSGSPDG